MTKLEMFKELIEIVKVAVEDGNKKEELLVGIKQEILLTTKKNDSSKKSTSDEKLKQENEKIKLAILELMEDGKSRTCTQIISNVGFEKYSTQKISALMGQLLRDNLVTKEIEKRVSFFSIVPSKVEEEVEIAEEVIEKDEIDLAMEEIAQENAE